MELERLGTVIGRRAGLIALIVGLTALVSAVYPILHPPGYTATSELLITPLSAPGALGNPNYYLPYYEEQAAQYILDDFAEYMRGTTFAQAVVAQLKQSPSPDVRQIADRMTTPQDLVTLSKAFKVNRVNRLLRLDVSDRQREVALAIAAAADQVVMARGPQFFAGGDQKLLAVDVADAPHLTQQPSLNGQALFWLLRTLVGLAAALAIVLVLHYLDDRLYDADDIGAMVGLPVLGTVSAPALRPARRPRAPRAEPARAPVTAR